MIFRGDVDFVKNKKPYSFYIDSGGSTCWYFVGFRYDSGNRCFFAGAFSMNSFEYFHGKIICIVGAQELETVETFVFSLFFDC